MLSYIRVLLIWIMAFVSFCTCVPGDTVTSIGCGGRGDNVCSMFTSQFWDNDSGPCDRGLKSSKDIIASLGGAGSCVNDRRDTQSDSGTWIQWALDQQRNKISADLPLNLILTLGTHNSYSNIADGDTDVLSANQYYSITDQLNLGARSLRLDPKYYFGQLRLCHSESTAECILMAGTQYLNLAVYVYPALIPINLLPPPIPEIIDPVVAAASVAFEALGLSLDAANEASNGDGVPMINNRLYVSAIREISEWLASHPNEVITLNFNQVGSFSRTDAGLVQPLVTYFGSKMYTQDDLNSDLQSLGRYATISELRSRKKQILVNADITFQDPSTGANLTISNGTSETVYPNKSGSFPQPANPDFDACRVTYKNFSGEMVTFPVQTFLQINPTSGVRTGEGRTASDALEFTGLVDEAQVLTATNCGYTEIDFDFFMARSHAFSLFVNTNPDQRREKSIWSWKQGVYGGPNEAAALEVSSGRWIPVPILPQNQTSAWFACAASGDPTTATYPRAWNVVSGSAEYYSGFLACKNGWTFSHPRNALDNQALEQAALNAGADVVYTDFTPTTTPPAATAPAVTPVYMDQGGPAPDPIATDVDGYPNLFFNPVQTQNDQSAFYLLNAGNLGSPTNPASFLAGPVYVLTGILPEVAQSLQQQGSGYGSTFQVDLYDSTSSGYAWHDYPSGVNPATGGVSLHVMTPSATTLTASPATQHGLTYTLTTTVNAACPQTPAEGGDNTPPTGIVQLTDTVVPPGGVPVITNLGWVAMNNGADPTDPLGDHQLQNNCTSNNTACANLQLSPGHHVIAASYQRDATFNSSMSAPVPVDVNGFTSPSQLEFAFAPGAASAQTQTLSWNGPETLLSVTSLSLPYVYATGHNPFQITAAPPSPTLPGSYTGSLMIDGFKASPAQVPVEVDITGTLSADQTSVTLTSSDQSTPATQIVNVTYEGGPLYVTSPDAHWLTAQVTPSSVTTRQSTTARVAIIASPTGLSDGVHTGTLVISQPGNPNVLKVSVSLNETITGSVPAITITTSPANMHFACDGYTYTAPYTLLDPSGGTHYCAGATTVQQVATGTRALFDGWSDGEPGLVRTITATAGQPQTLGINYRLQNEVTVTVDPACSGTVVPLQSWYNPRTPVTLTATANPGFTFAGYSGDITSAQPNATQQVNAPAKVVAHFVCSGEGCPAHLTPLTNNVSFSKGVAQQIVNINSTDATNPITFQIAGGLPSWLEAVADRNTTPARLTFAAKAPFPAPGNYSIPVTIHPSNGTTDAVIEVSIETEDTTIETIPSNLSVSVDGGTYTSPATFPWISGSSHTIGAINTQNPPAEYLFRVWNDGGAQQHSILAPEYGNPRNYTAHFDTYYAVAAKSNPASGGTVTITGQNNGSYYLSGSTVTLTATPATGFEFGSFSGTVVGETNPSSVLVNGPLAEEADFNPASGAVLFVNTAGNGTIMPGIDFVTVPLQLINGTAGGVGRPVIAAVDNFEVITGTGSITLESLTPIPLPDLTPHGADAFGLLLRWPATATRLRFTVHFAGNDGAYAGSTTLTVNR